MTAPIVGELSELFPDDIVVERHTGSDENGTPNPYGAPENVRGRVVGRTKLVADSDGQEHVSSVQATLAGSYGFTAKDRYTLPLRFSTNPSDPSDLTSRQPRAIAVDNESDENGGHHQTVQFSNARLRAF